MGCAYGFFLDEARALGWDVRGLELNGAAARHAAESLGLDVRQGSVEALDFPDRSFDCVTVIGTLEHFRDPVAAVARCSRLLKTGGHLAVTTIDTEGLVPLYDVKPPEHLAYFSGRSLGLLFRSQGLEVVRQGPYWSCYHLSEALCRAFRLVTRSRFRIERALGRLPLLKTVVRVPTNEMFMLGRKAA